MSFGAINKQEVYVSAPHTNIEKQQRRHKGPLIGMALAAVFVGVIILYWTNQEPPPMDPTLNSDVQTEGTGGAVTGTEAETSPDAMTDPVVVTTPTVPGNSTTTP